MLLFIALLLDWTGGLARNTAANAPSNPTRSDSSGWLQAAQAAIRQSEYNIHWQTPAGAYQAPNRANNLRVTFTNQGVRVNARLPKRNQADWEWGMAPIGLDNSDEPQVAANRIAYPRGEVAEWYVNDEKGLWHGWNISAPMDRLEIALIGTLKPQASVENGGLVFLDPRGAPILRYSVPVATNANGHRLPAQVRLVSPGIIQITIEMSGLYPVTITSLITAGEELLTPGAAQSATGVALPATADALPAATVALPAAADVLPAVSSWSFESDQSGSLFGWSVGTAGDVNGDGFSDVIVGAPDYDNGQANEGSVFVYNGSAAGLSTSPTWSAEGNQADASFGQSVGTAGDVNGDGFADVIIGAYRFDNGQIDEGAAFVYHGSAAGLDTAPAWSAESDQAGTYFGFSVGTAGDTNGDGFSEVVVGAYFYTNGQADEGRAYIYPGSASGLAVDRLLTLESNQMGANFGFAVGTAGDVNGDGFSDLIVGAPAYSNGQANEGRVSVYFGSATGLTAGSVWTVESNQANAGFGWSVGTAGDVNGDGYADVMIGAPAYSNDQTNEGAVFVYNGSAAGLPPLPSWSAESNQADAYFGRSAGTAGDVNGDGYADIIVGAFSYSNGQEDEGGISVYLGAAAGFAADPSWNYESNQAGAWLGLTVSTAGDVNGDGFSDVIAGAPYFSNNQVNAGAAFIFAGSPGPVSTAFAWSVGNFQASDGLGSAAATAGDVNGDGYADVIIGVPLYSSGLADEGAVFAYYGSPAGLPALPSWSAGSDQAGARMGIAVGTAGDVNGDGYDDVIVGVRDYDGDQVDEGAVFVYYGSASGLAAAPSWKAESHQSRSWFGWSAGTAGDVNGDGYSEVIVGAHYYNFDEPIQGRAFVYLGSATGLAAAPAWVAEGSQVYRAFGASVGTAGDVNGDGFSDVIVGAPLAKDGRGAAFVYYGSPAGPSAVPSWSAESSVFASRFAVSVGTAGDVNGDGFSDVIIGAPFYTSDLTYEGAAYIYNGSAAGLAAVHSWVKEGNQAYARCGFSVGTAGDVNGDGFSDVIVGGVRESGYTSSGTRGEVYLGSSAGLDTTNSWQVESTIEAPLGYVVGASGDVNGDGYSDVIAGWRTYQNDGKVFLYYGNGGPGQDLRMRQVRINSSVPIAYLGRTDTRSAFGLRLLGRAPLGREDVQMEWQVAPLGTPFYNASGVLHGATAWQDTGTTGALFAPEITGLMPHTAYHWRLRLRYRPGNALGLVASRWMHMPRAGWNETALRTSPIPFYLPVVFRMAQ